jgi:hypothetical protein
MDFRIREITQGYDTINSIDRNSANTLYGRYYLLHSVPRFNNPTGVFDNDQYMLEIITSIDPTVVPLPTGQIESFELVMSFLLGDNCADCVELGDPIECTPCDVEPNFIVAP